MKTLTPKTTKLQRALVTGASGFIGRNLIETLVQQGIVVTAIGRSASRRIPSAANWITAESLDEIHPAFLKNVDALFHFAAITDTRCDDELELRRVNLDEPMRLFERALHQSCSVVYASSMAVYGNVTPPFRERGPHNPLNLYARLKLALDDQAMALAATTNGVVVSIRYANVYGPYEEHKGLMASMVSQLLWQMRQGDPVLFDPGDQRRDFVYVDDAIAAAMSAARTEHSCIVNCGSGESVTFNHLVSQINIALGTHRKPIYIKNPHPHLYQSEVQLDLSLAKCHLGYQPRVRLSEGIRKIIEHTIR